MTTPFPVTYEAVVLADGPNGYWRLGETSGSVLDISGNGYDGTSLGTPTRGVTGLIANDPNKAYSTNSGTGYVSVPTAAVVMDLTEFSIELWFSTTSVAAGQTIYSEAAAAGTEGAINVAGGTNKITFAIKNGGVGGTWYSATDSGPAVTVGPTYHVVATLDQTNGMILYVNGSSAGTDPNKLVRTGGTAGFEFGKDQASASPYNGTIDEVAVYTRALTADEVAHHYAVGT